MGRDYSCCCLLPNPAILILVLFYTFDNDLDTNIKYMASVNFSPLLGSPTSPSCLKNCWHNKLWWGTEPASTTRSSKCQTLHYQLSLRLRCGQVTLAQLVSLTHIQLLTRRRELQKWWANPSGGRRWAKAAALCFRAVQALQSRCPQSRTRGLESCAIQAQEAMASSTFRICRLLWNGIFPAAPWLSPGTRGLPHELMRHSTFPNLCNYFSTEFSKSWFGCLQLWTSTGGMLFKSTKAWNLQGGNLLDDRIEMKWIIRTGA